MALQNACPATIIPAWVNLRRTAQWQLPAQTDRRGNLPAESKYGDRRHKTDRITRHLDNAIFDKDRGKAFFQRPRL